MTNTNKRTLTAEQQVQRAWDIQQIKNVMGRHAYYHEYNHHDWEMDELWIQKPENKPATAFGQGHGFQIGYELVDDNYNAKSFNIFQVGLDEMIAENPAIENKPENIGLGSMIIHLLSTPLIEVAEDGLTAQGVWDGNGQITMAYPGGVIETKIMFERYSVDFVKEDGEWKIWKMFIATDILIQPAGSDVRDEEINISGEMEFNLREMEEEEEDPATDIILNHPMVAYTPVMNNPDWPPYPEPYRTYSEAVSNDVFSHPDYQGEVQ